MKVYFYIDIKDLPSIKKYGYLSARAYYNIFKKIPTDKYIEQFNNAKINYSMTWKGNITDQILQYLDWRDEMFNKGSMAIYFLYSPIPNNNDIKDFIKKYRYDFLKNKILLEYNLTNKYCPIIKDASNKSEKYWIYKWKSQPHIKALWFNGIPHGYFIPKDGIIPYTDLKILNPNEC